VSFGALVFSFEGSCFSPSRQLHIGFSFYACAARLLSTDRMKPGFCALFAVAGLSVACSKSAPPAPISVSYGDPVGVEFGDAKAGGVMAAIAMAKGATPDSAIASLAAALLDASKQCPTLAKETADPLNPPTLRFALEGGKIVASGTASDPQASELATCMTKLMLGKAATLDPKAAATVSHPVEVMVQLMQKSAVPK
jgi:hypothetical protein